MKHGANLTSPHVISQYVFASTFSDEVIHDEESSHKVPIVATLFDSNASFFIQEENIEGPYFFVSLEIEDHNSSSYDVDDEKEVTNGYSIAIDDDSFTHSIFFMSYIIYSKIYVPDPSHFVMYFSR